MNALVVAPAWIGDMVMAGPLIEKVRGAADEVHVLAPHSTAALAARMPGVADVHELAVGHGELKLNTRYRLARRLRGLDFACAYVLPNTWKSALVPWLAGIPRRVGFRGEHRYGLLTEIHPLDPQMLPRLVDRYLTLAGAPELEGAAGGLPALRVDEANLAAQKRAFGLGDGAVVCLCPGAEYGPAKRWPARHFAAVATQCRARGFEVWLLGSENDRDTCAGIAAEAGGVIDLCGRTSIGDAVDLLSVADAVVTNDSGLMHVAASLGRRVIALFGSTSAEFTPPVGELATVLETSIACRPCFQRTCPLLHHRCLTEIGPDVVMREVLRHAVQEAAGTAGD